jgi:hypothetical protein
LNFKVDVTVAMINEKNKELISLKVKVWLVNADLCKQNVVLCIVSVCVHGTGVGSTKYVTRPT